MRAATATTFSRSIVRQAAGLLRQAGVPEPGSYLSVLVHATVDLALRDADPLSEVDRIEPDELDG
jgi:hypothetical protein